MSVADIVTKGMDDGALTADEIGQLFEVPLFSEESAQIIAAGRKKSERACDGKAEVHAQVGLNVAPCPRNCKFCAFAAINGVFREASKLTTEEAIRQAQQFEKDGANAIFFMATAQYPMEEYIDISRDIRDALKPDTVMIANVGDFSLEQAHELKDAGYAGIYHAVRLGEGVQTTISPEERLKTFEHCKDAGLAIGTCLEPVGPEHTTEELVEKTLITRDIEPTYSGSARRIPIPDTELAPYGIVSEARMAHILGVVRLALGYDVPGNCTHEPNVIGCAAGANLLWAESGSNPRDTETATEGKRGMTVARCREVLEEAEWDVLDGPSKFYS